MPSSSAGVGARSSSPITRLRIVPWPAYVNAFTPMRPSSPAKSSATSGVPPPSSPIATVVIP